MVVHMTKWFISLHCSLFGSQVSNVGFCFCSWTVNCTPHRIYSTRDWVYSPTLELHLSCSLSRISTHYKQTSSTETRYRLNFWYCMADLVLKESFVCCCDLKFLRNSIVFPLGLKSDKTEKTRKRMVSFQSFQVMMVK